MGVLIFLGVVFVLIASAVLIGGAVTAVKQINRSARGIAARGTVVDLVWRAGTGGAGGLYCPAVEFTTAKGQPVRFTSEVGGLPARHRVGQSIAVKYDPTDPRKAEVDSGALWLAPGMMIGGGCIFLLVGVALLAIGFLIAASQT